MRHANDCMSVFAWVFSTLLLCPLLACAQGTVKNELLSAMFQDHAVLQRDQPIRVWGDAKPGRQMHVKLGAHAAKARANQAGAWEVMLPSLPAGGPYILTVSDGSRTQSVSDLLVGDVWLCSGQSNMELPVWRSLDAASELSNPIAPTIRLLTVPQVAKPTPLRIFSHATRWNTVNSATLKDFSAACFYFARELQKSVEVPMGLINASWGGARIQAWIDADALKTDQRYRESLDVLALYEKDPLAAAARWGQVWGEWWETRAGTTAGDKPWGPADASAGEWRKAPAGLGPWERWGEPALADFNGMVWFRTAINLTSDQAQQDAVLELGALDETDMTWVNGRAVGGNYDPGMPRRYPLPQGLLKAGENKIAINVLDTYREGGMSAPASAYRLLFEDGSSVVLHDWEYRMAATGQAPPNAPWQSAGGVSTLYNGMIAPLGGYGVRGALWYQGESNTGEAAEYADLLRRLSTGLRTRFGEGLPIVVVQLAGYGIPASAPGESGWASLREAQRQVADSDPRMVLVIALDLGDRYDIHPPNKQELGRRAARAARHLVYGQPLSASGPVPLSAVREGDEIVLRFKDVDEGLVAYGAEQPLGFEICGTAATSCQYATARIKTNAVVLDASSADEARRVRYGWADNPVITLFDRSGLPVGPFEIEIPTTQPLPHEKEPR